MYVCILFGRIHIRLQIVKLKKKKKVKQVSKTGIQKAFNHTSLLISSISKLGRCNPWSRSASNYSEIFSDNNGRGTLCPSDIGNKWKANVSVARMNDVHMLREIIEIRDGENITMLMTLFV